jgi:hypothetical protein
MVVCRRCGKFATPINISCMPGGCSRLYHVVTSRISRPGGAVRGCPDGGARWWRGGDNRERRAGACLHGRPPRPAASLRVTRSALTASTRPATITPLHSGWVIPVSYDGEGAPHAWRSSRPVPHHACPDVSPDATLVSPEAATPHAHLCLPTGWDGVTVPIAVLPKREPTACVSHLQSVTTRRA